MKRIGLLLCRPSFLYLRSKITILKKLLLALLLIIIGIASIIIYQTTQLSPVAYTPLKRVSVNASAEALQGALRFKTISHKKEMIDTAAFTGLHNHLDSAFPLITQHLKKEIVNDFSLLYTWPGSDKKAGNIVLMGHQDVVPVEYATREQWVADPFGGTIKDGFIYGRGTLDDKGCTVSILNAVEGLLQKGFTPKQTIYFCFGHDEEIGGQQGAVEIVKVLKQKGVKANLVLDEGGTLSKGIVPGVNDPVALIGISEKGYMSVDLSVSIAGGHSSMPEERNALRVLTDAIYKLNHHPLPNQITPPIQGFIEHVGPHLPFTQKMAFANTWLFKHLIFSVYEKSASGAALIHTTQVNTIIQAGIKDNVVPNNASAVINYRLLPGDTPEKVLEHIKTTINDSAVRISIHDDFKEEPSPVSDYKHQSFTQIASAVKAIYPDAIVSPYMVLGATDGRYFYEISDHVYRFSPFPMTKDDLPRIHGINERIAVKDYSTAVDFYATLLSSF